jgi:hypothetical protein
LKRKSNANITLIKESIERDVFNYLCTYYTDWHYDLLIGTRTDWLQWHEERNYFEYLYDRCALMEEQKMYRKAQKIKEVLNGRGSS